MSTPARGRCSRPRGTPSSSAVPLLATHPVTVDTGLALMAGVLSTFEAAGIDRERALTVVQSVVVFTLGHALAQVGPDGELSPTRAAGYHDSWFDQAVEAMLTGFAPLPS